MHLGLSFIKYILSFSRPSPRPFEEQPERTDGANRYTNRLHEFHLAHSEEALRSCSLAIQTYLLSTVPFLQRKAMGPFLYSFFKFWDRQWMVCLLLFLPPIASEDPGAQQKTMPLREVVVEASVKAQNLRSRLDSGIASYLTEQVTYELPTISPSPLQRRPSWVTHGPRSRTQVAGSTRPTSDSSTT